MDHLTKRRVSQWGFAGVLFLLAMFMSVPSSAHKLAPALLQLTETQEEHYQVYWKIPAKLSGEGLLLPTLPRHCVSSARSWFLLRMNRSSNGKDTIPPRNNKFFLRKLSGGAFAETGYINRDRALGEIRAINSSSPGFPADGRGGSVAAEAHPGCSNRAAPAFYITKALIRGGVRTGLPLGLPFDL